MKTVKEVSKLTGISVRTLHYYDEIGLLKPTRINSAGYRFYDGEALSRLQQILFFRDLDFPLKEIRDILNNPSFDPRAALENHRRLLFMKRSRINELIRLVDRTLKGESKLSFEEFDESNIEKAQRQYAEEAKSRWGNTDAYRENAEKTSAYRPQDWKRIQVEAEQLYRKFAENMKKGPENPAVQELVKDWQAMITKNFYQCTDSILAGLGEMYANDPRFQKNINQYGEGLAEFMSNAIRAYCGKK